MTQRYAHLAPQTLLDAAEVAAAVIQRGASHAGSNVISGHAPDWLPTA